MARIVCALGVPHVPVFPRMVAAGSCEIADRFSKARAVLRAANPSLLVVVANDHLNTFFLDNMPTFSMLLGEELRGPIDPVEAVLPSQLSAEPESSRQLAGALIDAGFDILRSGAVDVDHAVFVPLHLLNMLHVPLVVLNVNAYVPPLPSANRCHALGVALARAVEALPTDKRVAVIASGSFSQDVGSTRVDVGRVWSVPRPDWAARVADLLAKGDAERLIAEATPGMICEAGSVAGEMLSWIVLLGAAGEVGAGLSPDVDYRHGEGFAFGLWRPA